jgi:hypothetical protein
MATFQSRIQNILEDYRDGNMSILEANEEINDIIKIILKFENYPEGTHTGNTESMIRNEFRHKLLKQFGIDL